MTENIKNALTEIESMSLEDKVQAINHIKQELKRISPFKKEPVDCVQWVKEELVQANDYNPNTVAPPEMELLHISIQEDGYTQPIVVYQHDGIYEVVDGFHRNRVGKECADIKERIHGYLPVVVINEDVSDKGQRIASIVCLCLIAVLFIAMIVLAGMKTPLAKTLFKVTLGATLILPILTWIYIWLIGKLTHKRTIADFKWFENDK